MGKKRRRLPALRPPEVSRTLKRNGFRLLRRTNHDHYTDDAKTPHIVTVPRHKRTMKRRTLLSIIQQAGWSVEEFLEKM